MEIVTLGGKQFQVIANGPIKHDYWMQAQVHASGIDAVHITSDETPDSFVDALLARLTESGKSLVILGGMLAPAEMQLRDWTPQTAADSTAWIEQLIEPDDKAIVRGLVAQVLIGFFQSGLASLTISPTASATTPAAKGDPREPE